RHNVAAPRLEYTQIPRTLAALASVVTPPSRVLFSVSWPICNIHHSTTRASSRLQPRLHRQPRLHPSTTLPAKSMPCSNSPKPSPSSATSKPSSTILPSVSTASLPSTFSPWSFTNLPTTPCAFTSSRRTILLSQSRT